MEKKLRLLKIEDLQTAAECLKIMAHPLRLRIVNILMQGRYPVKEIAEMCSLPPHQCSEHLRLMKGHGFLDADRHGREVLYRISSPRLPGLLRCIEQNCGEPV